MEIHGRGYDRVLSLRELLSGVVPRKLFASLGVLLGAPSRIVDADGQWVMGAEEPFGDGAIRAELTYEIETIGYLEAASADEAPLRAAARLVELFMRSSARYFMASEMHIEVVKADYEELQRRHAALAESEARYKALAEHLEERVREQVKTIETAQRQLYQAEKMASVGQLAAGVAHEINNPIGFIRSNLGTAMSYVEDISGIAGIVKTEGSEELARAWRSADLDFVLEDFVPLLRQSIDGADRVARIVADLKGFSKVDQEGEDVVDLNDSIRSTCNVAASQVSPHADVTLTLDALPPFRCQGGQINQVFLNILLNAAQSMKTRGEIRIKTGVEDGRICIRVSDNGFGIPADILPRIFDPFFTTRDVGAGTGLGLTVCRDVIAAHGGTIEAKSEVGAGTTITIYLPVG